MFYYLYEIKNLINDKIYVGVHKSKTLDDSYMGSGKGIRTAIKKYGKHNFSKRIIEVFPTKEEMYSREAQIVTEEFVLRRDTYNFACGGSGGSIEQNRKSFTGNHTPDTKLKISKAITGRKATDETKQLLRKHNWARQFPEEQKEHAISAGKLRWKIDNKHRAESCIKISDTLKLRNSEMRAAKIPHPVTGIVRDKVCCPYCQKIGSMNTMSRWHFNNCKNYKTI